MFSQSVIPRRVRFSVAPSQSSKNIVGSVIVCEESMQQLSAEEEVIYSDVLIHDEDEYQVAMEREKVSSEELHGEKCFSVQEFSVGVREKLDSGASASMSGAVGRIFDSKPPPGNIKISGFNNSDSMVDAVGVNCDGRKEYYVRDMPSNLALLCANDYAQIGAVVLLPDSGAVIALSEQEKGAFLKFIEQYNVYLQLKVENRTYEVDRAAILFDKLQDNNDGLCDAESALSGTATRYFNSKINVSTSEERILVSLLTGLSFNDLYSMVKSGNVDGLPRDITVQSLNSFEHKYGRTPSILQMALPNLAGNKKGYMAQPEKVTKIGQRVEADFFVTDFNEENLSTTNSESNSKKSSSKLLSHGGAVAGYVDIDVYSGFVNGVLAKNMSNSVDFVSGTVGIYDRSGHKIEVFAADQGILTQSHFRVFLPATRRFLESKGIETECSEAYNHDYGTNHIERAIRSIKELIRFAVLYIFNNPNFALTGFSKNQILQLWGDLFFWAIHLINLKPCVNVPGKTKYEVFHNRRPDLRRIRLLPIFSVLYVLRQASAKSALQSNRKFWQKGLYIGPSDQTPGAIRVAVITRNKLKVIVTTNFKSVSDGGDLNIHAVADKVVSEELTVKTIEQISAEADVDGNSDSESDDTQSELRGGKNELPLLSEKNNVLPVKSDEKRKKGDNFSHKNLQNKYLSLDYISKDKYANNLSMYGSRADRMMKRNKNESANNAVQTVSDLLIEVANFVDWSTHAEGNYYYDVTNGTYMYFENVSFDDVVDVVDGMEDIQEECFRAVTKNVPRSFTAALHDPVWGDPARKEFEVVTTLTGAIVAVDQNIAKAHIKAGAEVLRMLTVYEEKIKAGQLVRKVRLVADGRQHHKHGNIYSPTPSREEFFILMHYFAVHNYNFYVLDEIRAFLNAPKQDNNRVFTKFDGNPLYFEIVKSVYGQKDASRNYQDEVARRMASLGFERLHMCSCIYVKRIGQDVVLVYDYVDDFIAGGSNDDETKLFVRQYRELTSTTDEELNANLILGMEISRDHEKRVICITMKRRIQDLADKYGSEFVIRKRNVPMPTSGYVVRDYEYDDLSVEAQKMLNESEIVTYMGIVGCLIWIQGVRFDIIFAVLYLAWHTKEPRQHHMNMALYCVGYLVTTIDLPLVLGGVDDICITSYSDASLGTGPKGRSVTGQIVKLGEHSGAIFGKSSAGQSVKLSSFEAELDGVTNAMKSITRIDNILNEMGITHSDLSKLFSDNKAMISFVHGNSVAKNVRHMEARMWYTREQYSKGRVDLSYMPGVDIPADKLTKLGCVEEHRMFALNIMGANLVGFKF